MSKIRIYSKKAFAIGPGAQRGTDMIESFVTTPMAFQDMDSKYMDDPTFKLAVQCGDIIVMEDRSSKNEEKIEEKANEPVIEDTEDTDETDSVEEFYEKLKIMKADEVKAFAEKYDAEFIEDDKLSNNKKRVLEAYKLTVQSE